MSEEKQRKGPSNARSGLTGALTPYNPVGREKGSRDPMSTRVLREAVLMAAEIEGLNGEGIEGLVGFCRDVWHKYPELFVKHLLARVLPLRVDIGATIQHREMTKEEAIEELRGRDIPLDTVYMVPPEFDDEPRH